MEQISNINVYEFYKKTYNFCQINKIKSKPQKNVHGAIYLWCRCNNK